MALSSSNKRRAISKSSDADKSVDFSLESIEDIFAIIIQRSYEDRPTKPTTPLVDYLRKGFINYLSGKLSCSVEDARSILQSTDTSNPLMLSQLNNYITFLQSYSTEDLFTLIIKQSYGDTPPDRGIQNDLYNNFITEISSLRARPLESILALAIEQPHTDTPNENSFILDALRNGFINYISLLHSSADKDKKEAARKKIASQLQQLIKDKIFPESDLPVVKAFHTDLQASSSTLKGLLEKDEENTTNFMINLHQIAAAGNPSKPVVRIRKPEKKQTVEEKMQESKQEASHFVKTPSYITSEVTPVREHKNSITTRTTAWPWGETSTLDDDSYDSEEPNQYLPEKLAQFEEPDFEDYTLPGNLTPEEKDSIFAALKTAGNPRTMTNGDEKESKHSMQSYQIARTSIDSDELSARGWAEEGALSDDITAEQIAWLIKENETQNMTPVDGESKGEDKYSQTRDGSRSVSSLQTYSSSKTTSKSSQESSNGVSTSSSSSSHASFFQSPRETSLKLEIDADDLKQQEKAHYEKVFSNLEEQTWVETKQSYKDYGHSTLLLRRKEFNEIDELFKLLKKDSTILIQEKITIIFGAVLSNAQCAQAKHENQLFKIQGRFSFFNLAVQEVFVRDCKEWAGDLVKDPESCKELYNAYKEEHLAVKSRRFGFC